MRPLIMALLCALAVTACGGGSSTTPVAKTSSPTQSSSSPTSATKTFTVTMTQTTTTPAPSATTGTTTTVVPASTACSAADLTPVFLAQNGATGNVILELALRNRGATPCHTYGYPGVQFLGKGGSALPTTSTRTTQDVVGSTPLAALTLAPGQEASFRMVAATDPGGGGGGTCSTASGVQIIAPDDTAKMQIAISGGAYECGKTTVSPLEAGTDAAPGV